MAKHNANGVDEMLDMLYEMIDDAKAIPFSNDCRLDRNGALDLLDSIRNRFPVELNESIKIVQQREDYLARAQKEAQRVLEQAQAQAQRMVDEQEIVRQARAAAEEAVRTAKAKATEILTKATDDAKAVSDEAEERAAAPALYKSLCAAKAAFDNGEREIANLRKAVTVRADIRANE